LFYTIDGEMQEKISDFLLHFTINRVKQDLSCFAKSLIQAKITCFLSF